MSIESIPGVLTFFYPNGFYREPDFLVKTAAGKEVGFCSLTGGTMLESRAEEDSDAVV